VLDTFQDLGRDMFLTGLVSSHTGSLSVRSDDQAVISRRGAMLGRLSAADLVAFNIGDDCPSEAPDDAIVHQAIYRTTDAQAVVYARPPATMALSLIEDRLSPANGEAADVFGNAPVLITQRPMGSPDVAHLVSRALRESRIVALRGYGVFARGSDLEDAFHMVSLLEEMCNVARIFRTLSREERQPAGTDWHERQPNMGPFRSPNGPGGRRTGPRPPQHQGGNVGGPHRNDGPPHRPPNESRPPMGGRRNLGHR